MRTRKAILQSKFINCKGGPTGGKCCPHGPYYYIFIRYGSLIMSCVYIGMSVRFPTLILIDGRWRKFFRRKDVEL
jgi:hypothetical protein